MTLKALFLDAGGTLFRVHPSAGKVYQRILASRGFEADDEDLQIIFKKRWEAITGSIPEGADRYTVIPGGEEAFWENLTRSVLEDAGIEADTGAVLADLQKAFHSVKSWKLFPETVEVLNELSRRDFHLGIISNWDSSLPSLLDGLGISGYFDSVTISLMEKVEKPSPLIFLSALEKAGIEPDEALHVGDRMREDYEGAIGIGMRALFLDRYDGAEQDFAVPSLSGILDRI